MHRRRPGQRNLAATYSLKVRWQLLLEASEDQQGHAPELQREDGVATAVAALEALATAHSLTSPSSGGSSKLGWCG
ncbi:hypothetical protein HaLaN_18096 [Haematococcus lacustris]|uniref:Uncharacterized protein n=1 Tax=Haematococcus lacustris TaxID=44745 RepID=A0A699ZY18_HAELA|nr:hypothetical protein HaLaN_18096 [Haematococcus lacustris]